MQAVTCFQCGRETTIAPEHYLCPECGADLQHLLLPETVAEYFRTRAHESSERGELGAALAEAERGLTYADSSELHLLAAILAKQLGRHDRMRQHVAAIPVDDTLRSEAEWLLRSHQDRARALQEAGWQIAPPHQARAASIPASSRTPHVSRAHPADPFLEELLGTEAPEAHPDTRAIGQTVASVAIVVAAITMVAASWWWIGPGTLPGNGGTAARTVAEGVTSAATATPQATALAPTATAAVLLASAPTLVVLPTPTPTPVVSDNLVSDNLVQAPDARAEVADSNPSRVLVMETNIFNIRQYLREMGRVELAELTIDARLQGETLLLQGFVHLDTQRRQLLEIAATIPGVTEVNAVNLLLRPLPTYIVQEGDTLWSIVFNIYGDVNRLDEFAAHNRDVLPSPDALAPGMELRVLPVQ